MLKTMVLLISHLNSEASINFNKLKIDQLERNLIYLNWKVTHDFNALFELHLF